MSYMSYTDCFSCNLITHPASQPVACDSLFSLFPLQPSSSIPSQLLSSILSLLSSSSAAWLLLSLESGPLSLPLLPLLLLLAPCSASAPPRGVERQEYSQTRTFGGARHLQAWRRLTVLRQNLATSVAEKLGYDW
jgi:hypothetical protein